MDKEKNGCCCGHEEHEHNHEEHNHDNCGCNHDDEGCGCGHEHEGYQMIYLTLDDDSELNCYVLGSFEVDEKSYIALLPEEDERVLLYGYEEVGDGEIELISIESEEVFEKVSQVFNEIFSSEDDEE